MLQNSIRNFALKQYHKFCFCIRILCGRLERNSLSVCIIIWFKALTIARFHVRLRFVMKLFIEASNIKLTIETVLYCSMRTPQDNFLEQKEVGENLVLYLSPQIVNKIIVFKGQFLTCLLSDA